MEIWKDIYNGYQVSNLGRVKSLKRHEEKIMTPQANRFGYLLAHFRVNGKDKMKAVHRVVAESFIPNPDNKREINHINGDKTDNRVENLEWVTRGENLCHAYKTGLKNTKRVCCVELDKTFYSTRCAAKELNLKHQHIISCCKGKQKTSGGYHLKYV